MSLFLDGMWEAPRFVATATVAGVLSAASAPPMAEELCSGPFPPMRFESTFCDVLRTNFIVGLCRFFPELAELGAEDPAVEADGGFKIEV